MDAWCSGARRSRSAPQDYISSYKFAPCYIYCCTILVFGEFGEVFYGCSRTWGSIIEDPQRVSHSPNRSALAHVFCNLLFASPSPFLLQNFLFLLLKLCINFRTLGRFVAMVPCLDSHHQHRPRCLASRCTRESHTGSVGSFWDSWASWEIALGSFSRCANYEPKSSKLRALVIDLLLIC